MLEFFRKWVEWDMRLMYRFGLWKAIFKANWHAYDRKRDKYDKWVNAAIWYAKKLGLTSITVNERWLP